MILKVTLNGTDENVWEKWDLPFNPFPVKRHTRDKVGIMQQIGSLDGEPIVKPEEEIPQRLRGWDEDFIKLCISRYEPGERVTFEVDVPI